MLEDYKRCARVSATRRWGNIVQQVCTNFPFEGPRVLSESMSKIKSLPLNYEALNRQATAAGEDGYVDPVSGYLVFSSHGLSKRGECCGSACRHCPYDHERVPTDQRTLLRKQKQAR